MTAERPLEPAACEHCGEPPHPEDEPRGTFFCPGLRRMAAEAGYGSGRYQGD